jgi:hypothetical protein
MKIDVLKHINLSLTEQFQFLFSNQLFRKINFSVLFLSYTLLTPKFFFFLFFIVGWKVLTLGNLSIFVFFLFFNFYNEHTTIEIRILWSCIKEKIVKILLEIVKIFVSSSSLKKVQIGLVSGVSFSFSINNTIVKREKSCLKINQP